jgi:hypothetical protein
MNDDGKLSELEDNNFRTKTVSALLFNERGKWKYDVQLDYTNHNPGLWEHWDLWLSAERALAAATDAGTSGVAIRSLSDANHVGWLLVVPEPWGKNSHPIMIIGR